jgi:uncharacterized membrane protein YgcG
LGRDYPANIKRDFVKHEVFFMQLPSTSCQIATFSPKPKDPYKTAANQLLLKFYMRLLIVACLALATLQFASCSGIKKTAGPTIVHDELTPGKTVVEALNLNRVVILRPLVVTARFPQRREDVPSQNYDRAVSNTDSMAIRFWNTFDSVFRFTVRDESLAKLTSTPVMPIDSMRAYDSLLRLASGGSFDLALIPDHVEIFPGSGPGESDDAESHPGTGGQGRGGRGMSGGGGRGGMGNGAGGERKGGSGGHGMKATLICNFTIVRAKDGKTIFSGQFSSTNAQIGGHGETGDAIKGLCEQFLQWKSD